MANKNVHIVFKTLNFLHHETSKKYKLQAIDKLILINLASHSGTKGIFPMQQTIAKELGVSIRYIRSRTKYLQQLRLLSIQKLGRKYHYELICLWETEFLYSVDKPLQTRLIEEPQFPYSPVDNTQQGNSSSAIQGNHRSGHRGTTVPTNNKVSNKENKNREREPLSLVFEPDEESQFLCKDLGLNLATEIDSFLNRSKYDKTQYNFQRWMKSSKEYQDRKGNKSSSSPKDEVRSTVKWFVPSESPKPAPRVEEPYEVPVIEYRTFKQIKADYEKRIKDEAQGVQLNGNNEPGTNSR